MAAEPRPYPLEPGQRANSSAPATHPHVGPQRRAQRAPLRAEDSPPGAARLDGAGRVSLSRLSDTGPELVCTVRGVNLHDGDALAHTLGQGVAAHAEVAPGRAGRRQRAPSARPCPALGPQPRRINGNTAPSAGVRATLGSAERQTPRGLASSPYPDGLTVAAPHS